MAWYLQNGMVAMSPTGLIFDSGSTSPPQAIWPGFVQSTNLAVSIWPPVGGTPDSYNVYRNGVKVGSGIVAAYPNGGGSSFSTPQYFYVDTGLANSTSYTYTATAVTAGQESAPTSSIVMTTLAGATTITPTTTPTSPATFTSPYSLPVGGQLWTATNFTTDTAAGTGTKNATGCGFQYALNNASLGDVIQLTATDTYTSSNGFGFQVPVFPGTAGNYVYITTSNYSSLPVPGTQVSKADIANMATIQFSTANSGYGITFAPGCSYVRLVGINVQPAPSLTAGTLFYALFMGGTGGVLSTPTSTVASCNYITLDRCVVGNDSVNFGSTFSYVRHGVHVNCNYFCIDSSYVYGFYGGAGPDANGIFISGGGPGLINNNYIEAASEGVIFGGIYIDQTQIPHDWVYSNNTNNKLLAWQSNAIGSEVKNHFETKVCVRFACFNNTHTNCWYGAGGQDGRSFVTAARDQQSDPGSPGSVPNQTCPWNTVQDGDVYNNVVTGVGGLGYVFTSDYNTAVKTFRVRYRNNICQINPGTCLLGTQSAGYGINNTGPTADVIIDHNTIIIDPSTIKNSGDFTCSKYANATSGSWPQVADRWTFTNNIFDGVYMVSGQSEAGGTAAINAYHSNYVFTNNLPILDGNTYPAGNFPHTAYASVGFADFVNNATPPNPASQWYVTSGTYSTASTTGGPVGATGQQFPLLGAYLIGGSVQTSWGTTAFQNQVATLGAAIIGTYPGWTGGGFNMTTAAAAVKAVNPAVKLTVYANLMELESGVGSSGSPYSPIFNAATTMNWFLRTAWPAGSITDADGNAQDGLNQTTFTVAGTGLYAGYANYLAWRATWMAANEFPGANWDGVFLDNVFYQPRVTADYNQSGSGQTASAAATNWRNGYAAYVPLLKAQLPATASQVWANMADWGNGSITGYNQLMNGGVIESIMGQSYSPEHSSWANMMNNYYKVSMNATTPGGFVIFEQDISATSYAGIRYGICSCLMDNGYYFNNANGPGGGSTIHPTDESNFNLGVAIAGPNNLSNGTYSSGGVTVYQNGVYRRDFANGIVLVNPRGNGAKTVTLEVNVWHLRAVIDTDGINNATEVTAGTSISLPDPNTANLGGSGLFLSRTAT